MAPPVKNVTMSWILKIGGFIMSVALAVSNYFLKTTMDKISEMDKRINVLELSNATNSGTKFTTADWATQKAFIESDRNSLDKRVLKLEENSLVIKEFLIEIKSILKTPK